MNPTQRHNARSYAVQALYQWQITQTHTRDIELQFLHDQITKKTDLDYFKELIHEIPIQYASLDQLMQPFLDRPITELDPVELAVLRLSIYELAKRLDIPYRVIINEALLLTKLFGSAQGYKFVNGILDQVARQLRPNEIPKK